MGAAGQSNDRGAHAQQVTITFCALALLCVILRVVTRCFIVRNPGLDDISVVIAWVFALGVTIAISFQVQFGLGLRQATLSPDDIESLLMCFWVSIWIYHLSLFFTKAALLLQYLRIFTQPWFRKTAYGIFIFIGIASLWTIFGSIFACVPVPSFWDANVAGTCLPHAVTWYFNAGLNVVTDLLIIILPMPVLKNLNMPFKQRVALMAVFALGGFVCIISFIRIKNLQEVAKSSDISYYNVTASTWSAIEIDVGIICACLPSLKATVTRFFPRLFSSVGVSNNYSNHPTGNGYFASNNRTGGGNGYGNQSALGSRVGDRSKSRGGEHFGNAGVGTYQTTITAKPLGRSRSQTFATRGGGRGNETELKTFGSGSGSLHAVEDGKIDVVTVVEQEVEHRRRMDSPYVEAGSSKEDGSDTGSERGLFPPYEFGNHGQHGHGDGGYSPPRGYR
ncbi:Hypothetical protein D9617_9g025340 [Elsinoe fawcettii]|nr:Hypothetical protein D9617_9g025340 [Elsinoe fawcettii]